MTIKEIKETLDAEVIISCDALQMDIKMGCGCDLMSDVLAFIKPNSILLTGLATKQAIYTAEMADVRAICFVRDKKPDAEVIKLAESKSIPLLLTTLPMFESCGRLYKNGLIGCSEYKEE